MQGQYFYGSGKLLLTSEYFVMDGARALALPTQLGQNMSVRYEKSSDPVLHWKSIDVNGKCWLEAVFDIWHFDLIEGEQTQQISVLQDILRQARKQNIHFLREQVTTKVETRLEFPLNWGLGSSSSLLYNIAQWAYISSFELHQKTLGGSGYDIACAESRGPILFEKNAHGPCFESVAFNPIFKDQLFFVYLNKKQKTDQGINRFRDIYGQTKKEDKRFINDLVEHFIKANDINSFNECIVEHESFVSKKIDMPRVKDLYFSDFDGEVKSLGAWGGDFVLASSDMSTNNTKEYFSKKGYGTIISFDEMISTPLETFSPLGIINQKAILGHV